MFLTIVHSAVFHGAVAGALVAAHVDFEAFKAWKSWHDGATYDWPTATFRWFKGAILGALTSGLFSQAFPTLAVLGQ